jgi:hypothetical protein
MSAFKPSEFDPVIEKSHVTMNQKVENARATVHNQLEPLKHGLLPVSSGADHGA